MIGILYIDGADAYSSYGVSLSETSYGDLVCLPNLKPIAFNDWHEKNGIEPDLSEPVIAAQSVTIPFHMKGRYEDYAAFIGVISDGAYHTYHFVTLGLIKSLRLVSCGEPKCTHDLCSFSLTFSDDDPMKDYEYSPASSRCEALGDYLLDGIDFANYGIRMLRGTMASIKKSPDIKENLKRDISVKSGVYYDGAVTTIQDGKVVTIPNKNVTYKSRTAQLRCLMRASNAYEFWRNRNALIFDLTRPGERILAVTELDKEIPCFYKGSSVSCFYPDKGKFWFEFTLNLEFFKGVI